MFLKRWKSLWNPEMFQGWGRKRNYFEGWYFKLVDEKEEHAMAVIPAVTANKNSFIPFIQIMDGKHCLTYNYLFRENEFWASGKQFEVKLGDNEFSSTKLKVDLPNLKCNLQFSALTPFPKHLLAPGIMGWYSFVPFMECYHGIVSVNHLISGNVKWRGKDIDFTGGRGYIEKDWGRSFPNSWIWMQSNHFDKSDVSVMVSVAKIPWMGTSFIGFIAFLLLDGKVYRFATYTGAKITRTHIFEAAGNVIIELKSKIHTLFVMIEKGESAELITPSNGMMTGKVNESLQAKVLVELKENDHLIFKGEGRNAGLEIGGEYEELLVN